MKILHVIFTKDFGGAERYVAELSTLQIACGHDVRVLIRPQKKSPNIKNILSKNLQVAKIYKLFQKWHVKKHIEIFEPDIIHCHLGKAAQIVGKINPKIPTVATLHIKYEAKKYAKMQGLICLNSKQNPKAQGYKGKVAQIGAWIAPQAQIQPAEVKNLRQKLNIKPSEKIFGSLCRLHQQKGLDTLIKAFTKANLPKAKLLIVGSGDEETNLKALWSSLRAKRGNLMQKNSIIFAPATKTPQLYYQLFDIFVSPSRAESMGLTLLEAMAAELPIISTATVGAKMVLKNQPTTLIPMENETALIKALKTTKTNPVKYNLKNFTPKKIISEIETFYRSEKSPPQQQLGGVVLSFT